MGQVGVVRHYQWSPLVVLYTLSLWCEGFSSADVSCTVNLSLHFGCVIAPVDNVTLNSAQKFFFWKSSSDEQMCLIRRA